LRVLIAGAGVAGLEAAFALRELAGDRVQVTLLAPVDEFVARPLSVGEPFHSSHARRYPLATLGSDAGAVLVRDTLTHVDTSRRVARTASGAELSYEALIACPGATTQPAFAHGTTVDDARIDELLHGLVQDLEAGYVKRLAIVIPAPMPWPLPGYELALMSSGRAWDAHAVAHITRLKMTESRRDAIGGFPHTGSG
jgi:sulfide:quinone oxidoreductase